MGGVVQGALGTASNLVGGLPIVGGLAKNAIGQAGGMLGMQPQNGQPGGQQGGLMGGKGGGQGGPGGMLGGLMGGGKGGGGPSAMNMLTGGWGGRGGLGQMAANFANQGGGGGGGFFNSMFGGQPGQHSAYNANGTPWRGSGPTQQPNTGYNAGAPVAASGQSANSGLNRDYLNGYRGT